jgi:hypothetical protein
MFLPVFQNCPSAVIQFIQQSTTTLQIAVCWFTHPGIFKALQQACERGVIIDLIVNYDQINFSPHGLQFDDLVHANAAVLGYTGPGLLHHKLAVADSSRVITGSFNWTRSEQNDHLLLIESTPLALHFQTAVRAMIEKARPLSLLKNTTPNQVSFAQLYQPLLWSPNDIKKRVVAGAKTWLATFKTDQEWMSALMNQQHILCIRHHSGRLPLLSIFNDAAAVRRWLISADLSANAKSHIARYCLRVKAGDVVVATTKQGQLLGIGLFSSDAGITEHGDICRFVQWLPANENQSVAQCLPGESKASFSPFKSSVLALLPFL